MTQPSPRILSLDQFRGYTVFGMFFVNFGGGFSVLPAVFKHHNTYCSYADAIMPQFFFAVGFALRLVFLRQTEKYGTRSAVLRVVKRAAWLVLFGVGMYVLDWNNLSPEKLQRFRVNGWAELNWMRSLFETLTHIGVTSLWVLPVLAASIRTRVIFALGSGLLHLGLSAWFWYDLLHARSVIDGGPLGFLTWTIPVIAGTVAYDWVCTRSPRTALRPLLGWGAVLMAAGYAVSCLGKSGMAAPPFFPPHAPVDLWTMSQRAGSLSYLTFAAGLAMVVYAAFVQACDLWRWQWSVFGILGANALVGYLLHSLVDLPFSYLKHDTTPLWQALVIIAAFIAVNTLIVREFNRRGWFLRL